MLESLGYLYLACFVTAETPHWERNAFQTVNRQESTEQVQPLYRYCPLATWHSCANSHNRLFCLDSIGSLFIKLFVKYNDFIPRIISNLKEKKVKKKKKYNKDQAVVTHQHVPGWSVQQISSQLAAYRQTDIQRQCSGFISLWNKDRKCPWCMFHQLKEDI